MVNKCEKHKERLRKEARKDSKTFLKKKKTKGKKRLEKDIKILLKKKKKIRNVSRSYVSIKDIII